jgi:hypothetical protein
MANVLTVLVVDVPDLSIAHCKFGISKVVVNTKVVLAVYEVTPAVCPQANAKAPEPFR